MNREVKFRAWHKEKKILFDVFGFDVNHVYPYENQGIDIPPSRDEVELIQYIGLTDRNGEDIYDGYIIQDSNGKIYVIRWGNDLLWLAKTKEIHGNCYCPKGLIRHGAVAVGNIYEDKHWLEGEK